MHQEALLSWHKFPRASTTLRFQVNEVQIEREDSLGISIEGITDIEESAYEIKLFEREFEWFDFRSRLELKFYMNRDV